MHMSWNMWEMNTNALQITARPRSSGKHPIMDVCRGIISLCLTCYSRRFWCGSAKIFPLFVCCVWMCKFRHGHLNTTCLPTAVSSKSARVRVCVCVSGPGPDSSGSKHRILSVCVITDKSDSQVTRRLLGYSFIHSLIHSEETFVSSSLFTGGWNRLE